MSTLHPDRRVEVAELDTDTGSVTGGTPSMPSSMPVTMPTCVVGGGGLIGVDGYDELVRIGQGGLGDVYRTRRESTGAVVAIKVLRDVSDSSTAWHRTRRELTALVALAGHGHVIQLIELLELDVGPALVMEYAPGGSVGAMLARRAQPLSIGEAALIGAHTASALAAAHARGIVHRDVKPHNLLIDAYGQVKLCDFGIASLARSEEFQARTSSLSFRYASPEDLEGDSDVDAASDVYSLGATLLHLVHGEPPTLKERLAPWCPPESAGPSPAFDEMLGACLQPDPRARPSAVEALDALERMQASSGHGLRALETELDGGFFAEAAAEQTPFDLYTLPRRSIRAAPISAVPPMRPSLAPSNRRRHAMVLGVVGLVLGVGLVVGWWWLRRPPAAAERSSSAALITAPVAARPVGLPELTEQVWPSGSDGECLVQPEGTAPVAVAPVELAPVGCGVPHDLQRFAVGVLDQPGFGAVDPFDGAAVAAEVRMLCDTRFAAFVERAPTESSLSLSNTRPSSQTWAQGDRGYQCFLGVPGQRLVGDAQASRW